MKDIFLLIFTVAALTFFLSMYLRLDGILSRSHLISFTTLISGSFSSSLQLFISAFLWKWTNAVCFLLLLTLMSLFSQDLLWSLAFPIDAGYSHWARLFLVILLNFYCTIASFPMPSYFFDVLKPHICPGLSSLISKSLLSYSRNSYFIPYFLQLLSIFSFCVLTPYPTINKHLLCCLFPFHSLFFLIRSFMTTCWSKIRYPMHAGRDTFTCGSNPVNTVIFNSLIWHFTLFEAVFYGFHQPVF